MNSDQFQEVNELLNKTMLSNTQVERATEKLNPGIKFPSKWVDRYRNGRIVRPEYSKIMAIISTLKEVKI